MGKNSKGVAVGALIAAGVGYLAGILTAPKSGKETREDIAKAAIKAKAEAERQLKRLHAELDEAITEGKRRVGPLGQSAKNGLDEAVTRAVAAKEKVRQTLSALHEGESDNKDLDAVIKDVTAALSDLKKFVNSNDKKS